MKTLTRVSALVVLAAGLLTVSLSTAEAGHGFSNYGGGHNHARYNNYNNYNNSRYGYGFQNQYQAYPRHYVKPVYVKPIYVKPCDLDLDYGLDYGYEGYGRGGRGY